MRTLITTDLHLTDKPEDAYRWNLFDWIHVLVAEKDIDSLFILGDLTDAKDKHSAKLVNYVAAEFDKLAEKLEVGGIHILKGNHDYLDPDHPFFAFLDRLPRVWFYSEPRHFEWERKTYTFLPHCKSPEKEWVEHEKIFQQSDYIFIHQTAKGARASNGFRMPTGLSPDFFSRFNCEVFSGDIHVPQGPSCDNEGGGRRKSRKGPRIRYVGAPYRIRFGDEYSPRLVLLDSDRGKILSIPSRIDVWKGEVKVERAEEIREVDLQAGDQIKVELSVHCLTYAEVDNERRKVKNICEELGLTLHSMRLTNVSSGPASEFRHDLIERQEASQVLLEFAGISDSVTLEILEAGLEIVE